MGRTPVGLVSIASPAGSAGQSSGSACQALHDRPSQRWRGAGTGWLVNIQDRRRQPSPTTTSRRRVDNGVGNHLGSGGGAQLHHRRYIPGPHQETQCTTATQAYDHRPAGARRLAALRKAPAHPMAASLQPAGQRSPTIVAILSPNSPVTSTTEGPQFAPGEFEKPAGFKAAATGSASAAFQHSPARWFHTARTASCGPSRRNGEDSQPGAFVLQLNADALDDETMTLMDAAFHRRADPTITP